MALNVPPAMTQAPTQAGQQGQGNAAVRAHTAWWIPCLCDSEAFVGGGAGIRAV